MLNWFSLNQSYDSFTVWYFIERDPKPFYELVVYSNKKSISIQNLLTLYQEVWNGSLEIKIETQNLYIKTSLLKVVDISHFFNDITP